MLFLSFVLSLGCSSGGTGRSGTGGQGGSVQAGSGGQGGTVPEGTAGQVGAAGEAEGGSGGSSGQGGGEAGMSGVAGMAGASPDASAGEDGAAGSAGGSGGAGPSPGPFSCTLALGMFTTSQWFNGTNPGGASKTFLQQTGIDATKWEGKLQKYSYIEKWADPTNGLWTQATQDPCTTNPDMPDRILFVGMNPLITADQDYGKYHAMAMDQAGWETQLNAVITNVKAKYPSVKEVDILTMGRAPNNMLCSNNNDIDTIIPAYEDAAYQAVAAMSNGFVKVGPQYFVPDCANSYIFANDSDYTTTAADAIAIQVAAYYAAHP
jgi:hypothetical protein